MATAYPEKKDYGTSVSSLGDRSKEAATDAGAKAKDVASNVASNVASRVGEAASFVGKKAEDATSAVGSGLKSLGGTLREHAASRGMFGSATSAMADSLESGGRYLQEQGLGGIGQDLTTLIRRNPIPAVLLGIGVGFLLSRVTTRA